MMKFSKIFGNRHHEIDKDLNDILTNIKEIKVKFSTIYESIEFNIFEKIPLNKWTALNNISEILIIDKTENQIIFIGRFKSGVLEYHNHKYSIEKLMLLNGTGALYRKNGVCDEPVISNMVIGNMYIIDKGEYHKFETKNNAITFGVLKKINS